MSAVTDVVNGTECHGGRLDGHPHPAHEGRPTCSTPRTWSTDGGSWCTSFQSTTTCIGHLQTWFHRALVHPVRSASDSCKGSTVLAEGKVNQFYTAPTAIRALMALRNMPRPSPSTRQACSSTRGGPGGIMLKGCRTRHRQRDSCLSWSTPTCPLLMPSDHIRRPRALPQTFLASLDITSQECRQTDISSGLAG